MVNLPSLGQNQEGRAELGAGGQCFCFTRKSPGLSVHGAGYSLALALA